MALNYLENLPLSTKEKEGLAELGASSAPALLAMLKAAPEAVENYLGYEKTHDLARALEARVSEAEKRIVESPATRSFRTGAIVSRGVPRIKLPAYSVEERDNLFNELQRLRQHSDGSLKSRQQIEALEQRLNSLLEKA